jgi:hypothetical protein
MVLCQLVFYKILIESDLQVSTLEWLEEIILNTNIESVLIFDRNLVGGDEIVWPSSFPISHDDGGRGCCSAVLRSDYYCDVASGRGKRSWS